MKILVIDRSDPYREEELAARMAQPKEQDVLFAENGTLLFSRIVYPDELDGVIFDSQGHYEKRDRYRVELKNTADYFQKALETMTGGQAVLIRQSAYQEGCGIFLRKDPAFPVNGQGYRLTIQPDRIEIASAGLQGITNGVYSFLEQLGCMFLTEDTDYIPKLPTIHLQREEIVREPSVQWRSVYSFGAEKADKDRFCRDELGWHSKLKLNGAGYDDWGTWCHSSFEFISPEEYFDTHPEYFAMVGGRRVKKQGPVQTQLCWTNGEVYRIISEKLFRMMEEQPDTHIWDVSQMDTWINRGKGCQCEKCREIDRREETPMGSLLAFINRLAEECEQRFPVNYISTLAYNYTAKPPKHLRPRENVIIKLCLMPGDPASSYADPKSRPSEKSSRLVREWGRIASHLLIWDYNVNYHHYPMPYPVIGSMEENQRFYLENHAYGIFHQMAIDKGAQDAALHAYLYAKLMWDSSTDVAKEAGRYLDVYYGAAAPYIAAYYQAVYDHVQNYGKPLYLYAKPERYGSGYLSDRCLREYRAILEQGLHAVAGDRERTARVEREMLGIFYVKAEKLSLDQKGRREALERMMRICRSSGITALTEGKGNIIDSFYRRNDRELRILPLVGAAAAGGIYFLYRVLSGRK